MAISSGNMIEISIEQYEYAWNTLISQNDPSNKVVYISYEETKKRKMCSRTFERPLYTHLHRTIVKHHFLRDSDASP